jgi:penicillin-binding protein 1C
MKRRRQLLRFTLAAVLLAPLAGVGSFHALNALYPFPVEQLHAAPSSPSLESSEQLPISEQLAADEQWRRDLPLTEISPWVIEATIAVEDHRFREHPGVDLLAIARAAAQNLVGGSVISGASTITMQVVKLTSPVAPRTLRRKAVEAFRALQLERLLTKDEILELYLNLAPYGGNHCGVESGALAHFGKHAADLSLDEATLLAGLPQSPTRYAPARHPERALARRDRVLEAALRTGELSSAQAASAASASLFLSQAPRPELAPHFARLAFARRPQGGQTTLDAELQRAVEALVERHALDLPARADVSVCVIELESGALRALVGSSDIDDPLDGEVNGATAWRSPGSALKPFVYAAAFEAHLLTPESLLSDAAIELDGWRPHNFDGGFSGDVTVREALRQSLNIPALLAARQAGLHRVAGVLESCGVRFRQGAVDAAGLSLVTGGAEVRLLDLTNAYATLGREGRFLALRLFEDEALLERRALSEETCAELHSILDSRARLERAREGAAHFCWKTGTSSGLRDAWSLGHDEHFAVGVWVGQFSGSGDAAFVGASAAAPLLAELFGVLQPR